jgi:hypothetical protein
VLFCYLAGVVGLSLLLWSALTASLTVQRPYATTIFVEDSRAPDTPTATPTPTTVIKPIGGTITIDGLAITLTFTEIIAGDAVVEPEPGSQFMIAHLKLSNVTTAPVDYNEYDFSVTSVKGSYHQSADVQPSTYYPGNELGSGRLKPGVIAGRDLLIQAPIGDHTAELIWDPPSVWPTQVTYGWNLGL